jgi:aminoglycoside phosphotransferase
MEVVVDVRLQDLSAIARRHRLDMPATLPSPWIGATCRVYPLGDVVVKIPFDRPDAIESLKVDAAIAPVARARGVMVPDVLCLDQTGEDISLPYSIVSRITSSVPARDRALDEPQRELLWTTVGEHLALIHAVVPSTSDASEPPLDSLRAFRQSPAVDPRPWAADLMSSGLIRQGDGAWLLAVLNELASVVAGAEPVALCHGDLNAANVLIDDVTAEFRALIDWGGAGWMDPAWDFSGVSLDIVPVLLAGHRSVAPLPKDDSIEARICWAQVQMRLNAARSAGNTDGVRAQLVRGIAQLRAFVSSTELVSS